jgi:hypothetical protein
MFAAPGLARRLSAGMTAMSEETAKETV